MALLNGLLGNGEVSNDLNVAVGASPAVGADVSDVDVLGLASIGGLSVDVAAPVLVGVSNSTDIGLSDGENGGLLGGLL